jgi:hypothetical protein
MTGAWWYNSAHSRPPQLHGVEYLVLGFCLFLLGTESTVFIKYDFERNEELLWKWRKKNPNAAYGNWTLVVQPLANCCKLYTYSKYINIYGVKGHTTYDTTEHTSMKFDIIELLVQQTLLQKCNFDSYQCNIIPALHDAQIKCYRFFRTGHWQKVAHDMKYKL